LTVVVLLSLGKESTQREYKIAFAENAIVDEHAEAVKVATAAKKKYTSIIRLEVTRQCSPAYWQQQKYNKTKNQAKERRGFI
jgi:ribosomal protein L31